MAGILIARWGYLHAFWAMGAILLIGVPVFILSVTLEGPSKIAYQEVV